MALSLTIMKRTLVLTAVLLSLLSAGHAGGQVVISKFMAKNNTSLTAEDGSREDWVEIYNAGTNAVNLLNWGLTDAVAKPFK